MLQALPRRGGRGRGRRAMTPMELFEKYGVPVIVVIGIILVFTFIILWVLRLFQYKRIKGSKYLSNETLSLIEHGVIYVLLMILATVALWVLAMTSDTIRVWGYEVLIRFMPTLIAVFLMLLFAFIIVGIVHRLFEYFKGNLSYKPKKVVESRFVSFIELPLEYTIYALFLIFAVFILFVSISNVTGHQMDLLTPLSHFLQNNLGRLILIVVLVLLFYLAYRFADTFFKDIKEHSTRTNPQLIDILRSGVKYAIAILSGAIIIFVLLEMAGLPYVGWIVFAFVLFIVTLFIVVVIGSPFKSTIAGIMIMTATPYSVGERVRVLGNVDGEVMRMGIMFTLIRTGNGAVMEVPNGLILAHPVVNFSRSGTFPLKIRIAMSPKHEFSRAEELLVRAATMTGGVVNTIPAPEVNIGSISGDRALYELKVHVRNYPKMEKIRTGLVLRIYEIFQREEIPIEIFGDA